jgi:GNAT superfamily N-acetyltransferase
MLARFAARTFIEAFGAANSPENMRAYVQRSFNEEQIAGELADEASAFFVADVRESLVGYARLHESKPPAEVRGNRPIELVRLYVDRRYHGSGVAAVLMQTSIDAATERGHGSVYLGVWEHNPRAQAFYRKWGFEKVGVERFDLGDDIQTDWIMERAL